jgi:predicted permease
VFGLAALLARRGFGHGGAAPGIFGITASFSNTIILGIPLVLRAYGDVAAVPLALIVGFHSACLFTLTTVVAEFGLGAGAPLLLLLRNVGTGLVTNPVLWGIGAGIGLNLLGLQLPAMVDQLAATLGAAALPAALFALGASLNRFGLAGSLREALLLAAMKLLVQPLLVWLLTTFVVGLAPVSAAVAVTIAALPSGINAYLFATRYETAVAEAASTILVSTAASVGTLAWLLLQLR